MATLDLDATCYPQVPVQEATCEHCKRAYAKFYPWATKPITHGVNCNCCEPERDTTSEDGEDDED
jgi:hypothetical protein